jgi:hypothetical protein
MLMVFPVLVVVKCRRDQEKGKKEEKDPDAFSQHALLGILLPRPAKEPMRGGRFPKTDLALPRLKTRGRISFPFGGPLFCGRPFPGFKS